MKPKRGIITALDIGSAKTLCLVADVSASGDIKVIGIGHQLTQGFKAGIITDIKAAEAAILSALYTAEKMAGETIEQVNISISANNIHSYLANGKINLSPSTAISDKEINKIIGQTLQQYHVTDQEVIHYFPLEYAIDGIGGIKDPKAMYGSELSNIMHVITTCTNPILNLANCLARCQVDIDDIIVAPYASAIACLSDEELEFGAIAIDMGSSSTSFAIFNAGHMVYTNAIPLGGAHITSDIALILATNTTVAERIKTLYGNALVNLADKETMIDVEAIDSDNHSYQKEPNYISKTYLSNIIQPRLEEIFELINERIASSGYDKLLNNRIVLTGGASQMMGVKELATLIFNKPTRIARPKFLSGLEEHNNNAFSCAIGILKFVANRSIYGINYQDNSSLDKNTLIRKIFNWFLENF